MIFPTSKLREIQALDPIKDHQRIVFLSSRYDFPFDITRALEFALFRTFCVPSISALLDRTGEFGHRAQKRYDDTDLIISELMDHGYDSERGTRALRRMNQLHGRFAIANDDFLYVLSTFVFEPIRWVEKFGWRAFCEQERIAYFQFWSEVGRRMNIRQIPATLAQFEQFNLAYEQQHFQFTEANRRVGEATREMFVRWFPRLISPVVRSAIYALLDDALLQSFGFPKAPAFFRWSVPISLRVRARVLRFLPASRRAALRTELWHRSYPAGYAIEELGPAKSLGNEARP